MRTGLLALGIAAGVAACGPALAQAAAVPVVTAKRDLKIGANFDTVYDTNVSRTSPMVAQARGIHPEDEIFRPSLLLEITRPIGRNAAFLQANVGYDFHRVNTRLDRENVDLTGGGLLMTGPCHTTAFGHYARFQSDLQDTSLGIVQNVMQSASGGGQITCGRDRGLNLQLMGQHTDVVNSASRQKIADHRGDEGSVQLAYANNTLGQLGLLATYSLQDYQDRPNAKGGFGDEFWNTVLGVTYERQVGNKMKVQLQGGQSTLHRSSAPTGVPLTVHGTNYVAAIQYQPSSRLSLQLAGSRAFQPSNRPGKLFDLVTHTEGSATYNLGTRISVQVGGFLENLRSNQDTSITALPTVTRARRTSEYVTIHYRQSDRISAILDVRQEDKRTDLAAFNYSDLRATVTLAASF